MEPAFFGIDSSLFSLGLWSGSCNYKCKPIEKQEDGYSDKEHLDNEDFYNNREDEE